MPTLPCNFHMRGESLVHVRCLSQLVVGTLVCMSKITMHAVIVSQAVLIACTVPLQEGARGVWERPLTVDRPCMSL